MIEWTDETTSADFEPVVLTQAEPITRLHIEVQYLKYFIHLSDEFGL